MLPEPDVAPKFAHIYILDPQAQLPRRSEIFRELDMSITRDIQTWMLNNNPFAQVFQNIGQRLREDPTIDLQIVIKCSSNNDRRCYNLPTVEEVAIFMPGIDGEEF